ncbi:TonB family protein [Roseivirga sp.]|uniref:TonB family protein n=1 Tax=Roseivirga sp. TaxID=1964215 RepID=UPI003B5265CF
MSKKNRHIEHLTPELIKAYRNGELTHEEMHEVEKLMLENPLYEDGFEGLDALTDDLLDSDLSELDTRLDSLLEPENSKSGFWTIWRGIAAAIVFLLIATSLFFLKEDKPVPNKLLTENKKTPKTEETDSLPAANQSTLNADSIDDDTELIFEDTFEESAPMPELKAFEQLTIASIKIEDKQLTLQALVDIESDTPRLIIPMEELIAESVSILNEQEAAQILKGQVEGLRVQGLQAQPAPEARQSTGLDAKASTETSIVRGKVTGTDDGLPLPQVTVLLEGTTNGTATTLEGQYTLTNVPKNATLVFRYLGYITQTIKVGEQDTVNVELEPDATSLGEVVVTGLAASEEDRKMEFFYEAARPVDGFPEFNSYLKDNIRYPEEAKAENIRGRVTVEFTVDADGYLSDFEIIRGLGFGCDEEAIRLVREGPQWEPKKQGANKNPVSSRVRIRIRFKP